MQDNAFCTTRCSTWKGSFSGQLVAGSPAIESVSSPITYPFPKICPSWTTQKKPINMFSDLLCLASMRFHLMPILLQSHCIKQAMAGMTQTSVVEATLDLQQGDSAILRDASETKGPLRSLTGRLVLHRFVRPQTGVIPLVSPTF